MHRRGSLPCKDRPFGSLQLTLLLLFFVCLLFASGICCEFCTKRETLDSISMVNDLVKRIEHSIVSSTLFLYRYRPTAEPPKTS